jgi:hypothetical protein
MEPDIWRWELAILVRVSALLTFQAAMRGDAFGARWR